jgi:uncharacterized protein
MVNASVNGIFAGFWLSYAALQLGLTHDWYGIAPSDVNRVVEVFVGSWLVVVAILTLATMRLPWVFTLLFGLVDVAFSLVLAGTITGNSSLTKAGGYATFAIASVGAYLFAHAHCLATGGPGYRLGRPLRSTLP